MDRVAIGPVKGLRIAVAAFIISIVLFLVVVGGAIYVGATRQNDINDFTDQLHAGLIENCEKNGNPLREAVQDMLRAENARNRSPELRRFFPQIPPAELEAAIEQKVAANREVIHRIAPLPCDSVFPKP